jgi:hypothetical protein
MSAIRQAIRSTVHTTSRATPTQLVFGRDAILNISLEANWQYIKERKQRLIVQNNKRKNATGISSYNVDDRVMVRLDPNCKHGTDQFKGPFTVTRVYDNGTVKLSRATPTGGAVYKTWNIQNVDPCID